MTHIQWMAFCQFRDEFKQKCLEWNQYAQALEPLQRAAGAKDTPAYPLETAVVYSTDFDRLTEQDDIKLIVIGDNPGKDEQLAKNRRYLVGQSGKIADGFFKRNPELGINFRKHVLILNKTPIHTAKTTHLRFILKNGSPEVQALIQESQLWMAQRTAALHQALLAEDTIQPDMWLVGYAELKGKGLFIPYKQQLYATYEHNIQAFDNHVFVFQHFSMNRFLIDLKAYREEHQTQTVHESLCALGTQHRMEIFAQ